MFDILLRLRLTSPERHAESKAVLERIASMLTKLAKNLQQPPIPTSE